MTGWAKLSAPPVRNGRQMGWNDAESLGEASLFMKRPYKLFLLREWSLDIRAVNLY